MDDERPAFSSSAGDGLSLRKSVLFALSTKKGGDDDGDGESPPKRFALNQAVFQGSPTIARVAAYSSAPSPRANDAASSPDWPAAVLSSWQPMPPQRVSISAAKACPLPPLHLLPMGVATRVRLPRLLPADVPLRILFLWRTSNNQPRTRSRTERRRRRRRSPPRTPGPGPTSASGL